MSTATLTSKGQLTLPREIREALRVGPGDRLEFVRMDDGNYAVIPASRSVKHLKGLVSSPKGRVTLEDMDAAIAKGAGAS